MVANELWPGKLTLSPIQPRCLFHPSHQSLLPPSSHESISDRMHLYMHTHTQAHIRMHATCTCTDTPVPTHAHTRMHATGTCTLTSTSHMHMITGMPHAHIHMGCAVRPACCEQLPSFLVTKANSASTTTQLIIKTATADQWCIASAYRDTDWTMCCNLSKSHHKPVVSLFTPYIQHRFA